MRHLIVIYPTGCTTSQDHTLLREVDPDAQPLGVGVWHLASNASVSAVRSTLRHEGRVDAELPTVTEVRGPWAGVLALGSRSRHARIFARCRNR